MIIKLVTTTIPGLIMENQSQAMVYDYEKILKFIVKTINDHIKLWRITQLSHSLK